MMQKLVTPLLSLLLSLAGCSDTPMKGRNVADLLTTATPPFQLEKRVSIDQPWAMAFLPDGRALITTRPGKLLIWRDGSDPIAVGGVPKVHFQEQGGLGDVKLSPNFAQDHRIYLTYAEPVGERMRAVLAIATLNEPDGSKPTLQNATVIWRQSEIHSQPYHYSHRIIFSPDSRYLFLTSGERNEKTPAQDVKSNLGKVIRLNLDGSAAAENPFAGKGGASDQIWSLGHRNLLGIAFADDGRLWEIEMGPSGGDELNLIERGANYGWPLVSQGDNYDGVKIPRHDSRPDLLAPQLYWAPSVNPSSIHIYHGQNMPAWRGKALVGALGGQAIMLLDLSGKEAKLLNRWPLDWRVRGFAEDPVGTLWVIEDEAGGGIHRLTARKGSQ